MKKPIEIALEMFSGSQTVMARAIKVTQPCVHKWLHEKGLPNARSSIAIERATGGKVTREQLRPDIFGPVNED